MERDCVLTPLDIENKEFKRSIRGYNDVEVNKFLDEVIVDFEKLYKENTELKDKIVSLNSQIQNYKTLEDTLKNTLVVAQSAADELSISSKEKSKLIIQKAEADAEKIIREANEQISIRRKEYEELKKEMYVYRGRFTNFLESQLAVFNEFFSKLDENIVNDEKEENK